MKYLKAFKTQSDYIDFKTDGSDWVVPSVYFIKDNREIVFNPKEEDGGSGLTFPVTLVEGDNGKLGVDLYNWVSDYFLSTGDGMMFLQSNQELFVDFNGNKMLITRLWSGAHQYGYKIQLWQNYDDDYHLGWLCEDGSVEIWIH